jgi:hypothetical protein
MAATDAFTIMDDIFGFKKRATESARAEVGMVSEVIGFQGPWVWSLPAAESALFQSPQKSGGTYRVHTHRVFLEKLRVHENTISSETKEGMGECDLLPVQDNEIAVVTTVTDVVINNNIGTGPKVGHGKEGLAGPVVPKAAARVDAPRDLTLPCKTPVPSAAVVGETPVNGNSKHFNDTVKVTQPPENIGEKVGILGKKSTAMLEYDEKTGRWSRVWS